MSQKKTQVKYNTVCSAVNVSLMQITSCMLRTKFIHPGPALCEAASHRGCLLWSLLKILNWNLLFNELIKHHMYY